MTVTTLADPTTTIPTLREVLEDAIRSHPRSLQVALGPSDIGTACDRCLVHKLAGHKVTDAVVPWLPTVGTAVHTWVEGALLRTWACQPEGTPRRYLTEHRVTIGTLAGVPVQGNVDIYDTQTATVVDVKVVGKTTLDKVRRHGASTTYRRQVQAYGTGLAAAGHPVASVAVWFLPRNAVSLQHALVWQEVYDPAVTEATLARANALHAGITAYGVEAVLAMTPEHTQDEFACGKWPGETPTARDTQLDGLIPQSPGATATGSTAVA